MRLLLATDHYPPFIGGGHRQSLLVARGMASRGHEVAVVAPWSRGLPMVEVEDRVTVHRVRQIRTLPGLARDRRQHYPPPFPDPVTIRSLRRVIAKVQPDIIDSHGWIGYSVAAALVGKRIPLVLTARDYGYFCATRSLLHKGSLCSGPAPVKCLNCAGGWYGRPKGWLAALGVWLGRPLLARKMAGLHGVSSFVTDVNGRHLKSATPRGHDFIELARPDILAESASESQNNLAPSGISDGDSDVSSYLERLPEEPFVMFVGAFRKVKGVETLFDAYRLLPSPPPLVMMGTVESDTPSEFPPRTTVLTDVPNAAVIAAWGRAMFGVMPSLWPEPRGGTVAEAMLCGKPVIATLSGGSVDMVDESTGILVPPGDAAALAKAMLELIGDPARREACGRAAAERAREWTSRSLLPTYEQAYRDVISAAEGESAG